MTITYHAGRRIQGLSTDFVETLTFEDDFTTDKGWTSSNTTYLDYDSANQRLKTAWYGTGNIQMTYDLGAGNVSDTAWILRMKINLSASGGADNEGFIGVSSADYTVPRTTAQDFIGLCFLHDYFGRSQNGFYNASVDNAVIPPTNNNQLQYDTADNTDYWLELKRTSATSFTYTLYSDSAFSNVLGTKTVTIASTISSLRYIKFANYNGAATNLPNAYVDDIKFYNGVSSLTSKPTNVQSGSRFEETDTRKIYYGGTPSVTFEHDYSNSTGWTEVGTTTNIAGGVWTSDSAGNNADHGFYKALGFTLDNEKWYCEFDIKQTGSGDILESGVPLFFSTGTAKPLDGSHSALGIQANNGGAVELWANTAGTTSMTTGQTAFVYGTQYYGVLIRTSATNLQLKYYTDSARTQQYGSTTNKTISSGITGLTTIQHRTTDNGGTSSGASNIIDNVKIYNGVTSPNFTWTEEV